MRINRYIMECKYVSWEMGRRSPLELIDTLWNVNEEYEKSHNDTGGGINRYIMEYKR